MKELRLENFRCFPNLSLKFRDGINLLVGDNATGKTSILKACKYVLSSFFSGFSDENTKWISPNNTDFRQVIGSERLMMQELPIRLVFDAECLVEYDNLLSGSRKSLSSVFIEKSSKKNTRAKTSGLKQYKDYASTLQSTYIKEDGQVCALPLFAMFSTEDIHSSRKIDTGKFKEYSHKPSFGYYECLDGDGFFRYWMTRLLVLKEESYGTNQEIDIVRSTVLSALGENGCNIIRDFIIRPIKRGVYYVLHDGREVESAFLSDGYRRLVHIVTDLAFRCALLNRGIWGNDAAVKTRGIVLIDEIDLHLHPSLQSVVLKALRHAFPNLQFIVTSHAPLVMSGVESNEENVVYKLTYSSDEGYRVDTINPYGWDISTLTDVILGQTPRAKDVDEELTLLYRLIDEARYADAQIMLEQLKQRLGDDFPDLLRAETVLTCEMAL